jgi:hypothetical protein
VGGCGIKVATVFGCLGIAVLVVICAAIMRIDLTHVN